MRIFLVLICSLALASLAPGAQEQKKKEKKGAQAGEVSKPGGKKGGKPAEAGRPAGAGKPAKAGPAKAGKPAETGKPATAVAPTGKGKGKSKPAEAATAKIAGKGAAKGKPFKPQHFNLASKTKPNKATAPAVSFQQGRRIDGSHNWQGSNYQVFRNYRSEWHDRDWWRHNSTRVVFVFGGWYAWNGGWWYPAWGYDPGAYYAYDGPIYGYNNLPPDQVIANVQAALQQQGYYSGEVDGLLGPITREALANYQRDHGLYTTSAIDRPTLESLG